MPSPQDVRRHTRYETDDLAGSLAIEVEATVVNISLFGMALRTEVELPVGLPCSFALGDATESVVMRAQTQWVRPSSSNGAAGRGSYTVGLLFDEELVQERANKILGFIFNSEIESVQRVRHGRFTFSDVSPLTLESRHEFQARKISLSGMLLETAAPLPPGSRVKLEIVAEDRPLTLTGRVVNRSEARHESPTASFQVGVAFLPGSEEELKPLEDFIKGHFESASDGVG